MASLSTFTALTTLMAGALAVPNPNVNTPGTARINQVVGAKVFRNGPQQLVNAYAKYGHVAPSHVMQAAQARQSGSVTASPEEYDSEYLCPVTIGTPGVELMLDFDTGSSDLWVFSGLAPVNEIAGHSLYRPHKSKTAKLSKVESWDISYGDGSGAGGVVYSDKVVIGGVTATGQAVEAATEVASSFTADTMRDGLVGLAFPEANTCSPKLCTPFFHQVEHTLRLKLFTADLKFNAAGSYDFGFVDSSKYTGALTYTPVNKQIGLWRVIANSFVVNGTNSTAVDTYVVADTGTSIIILNAELVQNYYAQIPGAVDSQTFGGYVFPCNTTLPSFGVGIGTETYTVPGRYINYSPATNPDGSNSNTTCYGGIQSGGFLPNILGDTFLVTVFAVFDVGNTSLGLASKPLST